MNSFRSTVGHMWMRLLALSALGAFVYVLLEWLFFATKPSFMSSLGVWDKLLLLWLAPLPLLLLAIIWVFCFWFLYRILPFPSLEPPLFVGGSLFLGLLFCIACFLLIDNFTNTILDYGVRRVTFPWNLFYWALLAALFRWGLRITWKRCRSKSLGSSLPLFISTGTIVLVCLSVFAWQRTQPRRDEISIDNRGSAVRPNILFFGGDGISAEHTSLYGYERDTTPFAREFAQQGLVCENAFSNSSHTGASLASMLTGKLPTTTRLIYPPDILRGDDAFQHLPAILKRLGYRNANISIRHYADMFDLNMRDSFHFANSRRMEHKNLVTVWMEMLGYDTAYLIELMNERAGSRLGHLAGLNRIEDVFAQVVGKEEKISRSDQERLGELFQFIQESDGPFFAHVHLMQTHGPGFRPAKFVFSSPHEPSGSMNRYDDAILEFDGYLKSTVEFLEAEGLLEDTLFALYSDHGFNFETSVRIPLVFRFPGGQHAGRMSRNIQNLSLPSTVLDYLRIPQPEWMEGHSALGEEDSSRTPIFSMGRSRGAEVQRGELWELDLDSIGPPFFSLGKITVVICDQWFEVKVRDGSMRAGKVARHTGNCDSTTGVKSAEIRDLINQHLVERSYRPVRLVRR